MRRHVKKTSQIAGGVIAGIALVALIILLLLTQTDWGRRHVLGFGLDQLESRVHGKVTIGEVHGTSASAPGFPFSTMSISPRLSRSGSLSRTGIAKWC